MDKEGMTRSRLCYMDTYKGLLIFLMVVGHCLELYQDDKICKLLYWFIYSFHMPVFIFISGFFSKNIDKPVKSLFEELIVPMIPFELLNWGIHALGQTVRKPDLTQMTWIDAS